MIGVTGSTGVLGKIICSKLQKATIDFSAFDGDIRDENSVINWVIDNKLTYNLYVG